MPSKFSSTAFPPVRPVARSILPALAKRALEGREASRYAFLSNLMDNAENRCSPNDYAIQKTLAHFASACACRGAIPLPLVLFRKHINGFTIFGPSMYFIIRVLTAIGCLFLSLRVSSREPYLL